MAYAVFLCYLSVLNHITKSMGAPCHDKRALKGSFFKFQILADCVAFI
jgi:hypothetical protein